jgi:uncharacterized protein (TIGR02996 family)
MAEDTEARNLEAAMVRAIRDDPEGLADVLAYADWLSEQGDTRGGAIQFACNPAFRLADTLDWDARHETILLRAPVNAAARRRWEAVLRPFGARPTFYRRGVPEGVALEVDRFLTAGSSLLDRAPVRDVRLEFGKELSDEKRCALCRRLACCPALSRVAVLRLVESNLNDQDLRELLRSPHLGSLQVLDLGRNSISMEGALMIARTALPSVDTIDLQLNPIDLAGIEEINRSPHLPALRHLRYMNTPASVAGGGHGNGFLVRSPQVSRSAA